MDRRTFLGSVGSLGLATVASPYVARAEAREIVVTEPVHSTGYLPLYVGMAKRLLRRREGERPHHRQRGRPHQRGAGGTGLRVHRRPRALRLCEDQGRRAACGGELCRPRQHLLLRGQQGRSRPATPTGAPISSRARGHCGRLTWRHAELHHPLPAEKVEARSAARRPDACRGGEFGRPRRGASAGQAQIGVATEPFVTQGVRQEGIWGEPLLQRPSEGARALCVLGLRSISSWMPSRRRLSVSTSRLVQVAAAPCNARGNGSVRNYSACAQRLRRGTAPRPYRLLASRWPARPSSPWCAAARRRSTLRPALRHPGRGSEHLGRAVLQRPEGARALRILDAQRPARYDPEGARAGADLRARHGRGTEASLTPIPPRRARSPRGSSRPCRWR